MSLINKLQVSKQQQKRTSVKDGVLDALVTSADQVTSRKSTSAAADADAFLNNAALLEKINSDVPPAPINGYASLVNFVPSAAKPVHRWFFYREGYSQELVDEFVSELPRGSVVLDPFCGAGTSLISAQRKGLPSVGFDVNPISILVSRVKLTKLTETLQKQVRQASSQLERASALDEADEKPQLKIIDKVFDSSVLHALLVFRRIIKAQASREVRDFLMVAWLSILEGVSNAYKEGNGIKYKNRKRTENGYIKVDLEAWASASFPEDRFAFVRTRLLEQVQLMLHDLQHVPARATEPTLIEAGAESVASHLDPNSIALAIFSPPYCNCFNYFKMYKIELWMGEFVKSYEEMRSLNRRGLRSHVETVLKKNGDSPEVVSEAFAKLLDGAKLWDKRIPDAVRGYFIDMRSVLEGLHTVLKPSAKCVIVVGNSAYGGVIVPTDAVLAKIAASIGFNVDKLAVARSLTTSSQQRQYLQGREEYLRESILVLSKKDPRHTDHPLEVTDEIPPSDRDRNDKVFLIRNNGLTAGTHKFHRYPGKFIPHIPRWALQRYGKKESVIVDPFCGSGTTLVEAIKLDMHPFGFDVDPIARLVTTVKTTAIADRKLASLVSDVSHSISRKRAARFRPDLPTLSHWFTDDAIHKLGIIRDVIDKYRDDRTAYQFLLVCFAAIIRRASNADNQTQKTYVSHTKHKVPEDAVELFQKTLADYAARLRTLPKKAKIGGVDSTSALEFAGRWEQLRLPRADAIVTSPPYLNSVDYVYNQMAEYFWIGDLFGLQNQALQNQHKRKYVGTSQIPRSEYSQPMTVGLSAVDEIVERISRKSAKNGHIVARYFLDMRTHLRQASRVLKPGGTYVMVVGDSLVSGEPVPVSELMSAVAGDSGFGVTGGFGYEIRNRHMRFPRMGRGGILRYDWVIEMERDS